jgi:hypothetical protein
MKLHSLLLTGALLILSSHSAFAQSVDFVEPKNGAIVASPFKVFFGVTGMTVKPAGDMTANTGHHHLLINADCILKQMKKPLSGGFILS